MVFYLSLSVLFSYIFVFVFLSSVHFETLFKDVGTTDAFLPVVPSTPPPLRLFRNAEEIPFPPQATGMYMKKKRNCWTSNLSDVNGCSSTHYFTRNRIIFPWWDENHVETASNGILGRPQHRADDGDVLSHRCLFFMKVSL